jgi:hypothetical protein
MFLLFNGNLVGIPRKERFTLKLFSYFFGEFFDVEKTEILEDNILFNFKNRNVKIK